MDQALAFAREHVGLTMIDALSRFKRLLIEQDKRRAQEIADTMLSKAPASARAGSGCVVTSRTSYQYRPSSPASGKKKKKKAAERDFDEDDDGVFML